MKPQLRPAADATFLVRHLTPFELRVFALLSQGLTTEDIANAMHTSVHTVRKHRERIAEKMDLKGEGQYALLRHAAALRELLEPFVEALSHSR